MNLRYFLTFGMIGILLIINDKHVLQCSNVKFTFLGCGVGTGLLGVAYFARIHHFSYFIGIQLFNGAVQVCIMHNYIKCKTNPSV